MGGALVAASFEAKSEVSTTMSEMMQAPNCLVVL